MWWNRLADKWVAREDENTPRDPATGIITGAEPRTLGPPGAGRALLMVHGFVGSPNNFNDLPDLVAESGWHVRVMLLPGHGTSPREFETVTAEQLEQSVLSELDALREHFPTVVLLGHSLGGALVTLAAARRPVDGLILVSPYYAVSHHWYYLLHPESWAGLLAPMVRWVHRGQSAQPVNRVEAREKIVSYHWVPTRSMITAIDLASRAGSDATTAKISAPTLLVHSRKDSVTDPAAAANVCGKFPANHKDLVWLHQSDHIVFWDFDREEVIRAVNTFLAQFDALSC